MKHHPDKTAEPTRDELEAAIAIVQQVKRDGRNAYVFADSDGTVQWQILERVGEVQRANG